MTAVLASLVAIAVGLVQAVLAFYGFWLVLRTFRPVLPGAEAALHELDPLACNLTDPFVEPIADRVPVPPRLLAGLYLVTIVAVEAGLGRLPHLVG